MIIKLFALIVVGAWSGYRFADIDLAPPLPIKHRSAWTHGPVIPILIYWFSPGGLWVYFFAAFLLANAAHIARDLHPRAWVGGALIKFYPLPVSLGPVLSFVWLFVGLVVSLYVWLVDYFGYLVF